MAEKDGLSGLILDGTRIEGKLLFDKVMQIHGEVHGEITSDSKLVVGKNARINAHIRVKQLIVMGKVEGVISGCESLEIHEGGQVFADIEVKTLQIKPGALFDGKCAMIKDSKTKK